MKSIVNIFLYIGGLLIIASAVCMPSRLSISEFDLAPILMLIGAVLMTLYYGSNPIKMEDNARATRLQFQIYLSVILYYAAAYLMYTNNRYWIAALLVSAISTFVVSIRIPQKKNK